MTHICDADTGVVRPAVTSAEQAQGTAPTVVQDMRQLFDNRDIHAVTIATPNHWHCLAAIWAMQAGKHVYVEKPLSHNVCEGRRCVEVARAHRQDCARSACSRAAPREFATPLTWVHERRPRRGASGSRPVLQTPDQHRPWSGHGAEHLQLQPLVRPGAQIVRINRQRLHYEWHWQWDFGNGDIGNQGPHQMDIARWALGKNEMPNAVLSVGGRFGYTDDGETANSQIAWYDYGDKQLIFEVRGLVTGNLRGIQIGAIVYGTNGYLVVTQDPMRAIAYDLDGHETRRFTAGGNHFNNWINAIRANRQQDVTASPLDGHLTASLSHIANISHRLGRPQPFEPRQNTFPDSSNAQNSLLMMEEHLAANGVNLANTNLTVGRYLTMNREESFANDKEAIRHLTREYRGDFVVRPA